MPKIENLKTGETYEVSEKALNQILSNPSTKNLYLVTEGAREKAPVPPEVKADVKKDNK